MKIISTRLHAFFDYLYVVFLAMPWISAYAGGSTDTLWLAAIAGAVLITSLCTDYEAGLVKLIPVKVHLALDVAVSLMLIAGPWIFGIHNYQFYWPVLLGVAGLVIVLLSDNRAYRREYSHTT